MEVSLTTSSSSSHSLARPFFQSLLQRDRIPSRCCFLFGGFSSRKKRSLVIEASKKKRNSKPDTHSFVVKPEEATGPFPEAVLLKKKVVKEDGRVAPEFADADEEKLFEFLSLQLESDLNVERMRHYEVVYLIHEDHIGEVESVISKVQDFIRENKGRIYRLNNWGLRRLAYKIRKAKSANYVLMNFELEAKRIDEFKSMLDRDERVIRHLVIKRDEAITEDCPPPPEFRTLRAQGMDDDDDDSDDDEYDDDEEDMEEGEDGDWDDSHVIVVGKDEDEGGVIDQARSAAKSREKVAR